MFSTALYSRYADSSAVLSLSKNCCAEYRKSASFLLKYIYTIYTLSLQRRRSEGIKFASCCVALIPCTPGTCRSSALHDADFMPSDSEDLKRRKFLHFQGRRRKRTGSTLIEDNAENEEIIPF